MGIARPAGPAGCAVLTHAIPAGSAKATAVGVERGTTMETDENWTNVKTHKIWINGKLCGCAEDEITSEEIGSDWSDEVVKLKIRHKVEVSTRLEDDQRDHLQLIFQLDPGSPRNRSTMGMLRGGEVVFLPFEKEIVDGIPFVSRWSK